MTESVASASTSPCEVRIVYMSEAEEWAVYLQNVLRSARKFENTSVILFPVSTALQECEQELVRASSSIVLLMSATFLYLQDDPEVLKTYQKLFHPPNKMVLLFCGVSESDMPEEYFQHWHGWRKLYTDDDPAVYISTVLDSISDVGVSVAVAECDRGVTETEKLPEPEPEPDVAPKTLTGEPQPPELSQETELPQPGNMICQRTQIQPIASVQEKCLTVQPNRVQCGSQVNIFIILRCKMDCQARAEVEFSCQDCIPKREPGTFENDYTISVKSPDLPSGTVLVSLYCNDSVICSRPITYFTMMGEISNCLENVTNPLDFMCQAFNVTSNSTEALDRLLTDSLRSRMPTGGLHVFGVSQVEEENMSAYQRNEELPTLLHFAAKLGLKKLAALLLQCPGAMQAYSVVNKFGDYPNNIAEKNGFSDLRQFMDEYVETADIKQEGDAEVYEHMSTTSRDILMKYSFNPGCKEDIYESMMELDPDCIEDLYEDMDKALHQSLNPEEAMLRKFFQGKTDMCFTADKEGELEEEEEKEQADEEEGREVENPVSWEEEEDPYNMCFPDQIYDTVDENFSYIPDVTNRPPAPIPRPSISTQPEDNKTYISRVFHEKPLDHRNMPSQAVQEGPSSVPVRPVRDRLSTSTYDPYAGMMTPGQRQLISLQERVKVGAINVDEAVQEFKAWQQNQDRRSQSRRFQQENLKRLRDSITRRHKERGKSGKDLEITGPLPQGLLSDTSVQLECCVYEPAHRVMSLTPVPNPPSRPIQRGSWHNGSTSSVSSDGSNRLSTHSTLSYSSGADGDLEDSVDFPLLPRPPRSDPPPGLPPPRVPPRIPERIPENPMMDRYVHSQSRSLPRIPQRAESTPTIPRRGR
ncbi:hypothetical protein SKAU_G00165520 [Synaphobranchus kaupii]|uniref:DBB domain-containing protein n=1 Tax=Synaphobranchus kaupii TaxID=118154 RepID=A0A9Q1FJV4_SYNKA|nr:hypothetical protein SKAU_G00165520 [Synaphobranchus kaupii]